jgi:hypothetical protein
MVTIKHKRDKPLYNIEEICKMNGVNYDTSHSSDCIMVKDSDGKIYKIDSSFNIFEKIERSGDCGSNNGN